LIINAWVTVRPQPSRSDSNPTDQTPEGPYVDWGPILSKCRFLLALREVQAISRDFFAAPSFLTLD
jgi:hypothetical protein